MQNSTVICKCCGKAMVPRTRYWRGRPAGNHCPFCLSENWHGMSPGLGLRLFWLLGWGLAVVFAILIGGVLFTFQEWGGIRDRYPLISFLTLVVAMVSGYKFYNWFTAWDGSK